MNRFRMVIGYLRHRLRARRWDAFHSPYLFRLFTACTHTGKKPEIFMSLEKERKHLLSSKDVISRQDYGAGSQGIGGSARQKIADITSHAASLPFQCRFLAHLVKFTSSAFVLELGTSVGLSAAYMASLSPGARIVTIEGDPSLAGYAKRMLETLQLTNVTVIVSEFERYLESSVDEMLPPDLVFLDGHHESGAVLSYYDTLRPRFHPGTIVVVDDIHWSKDMQHGWKTLTGYPEVTQSVDAYHFGMLFFNPDFMAKEHHCIRFPISSLWR